LVSSARPRSCEDRELVEVVREHSVSDPNPSPVQASEAGSGQAESPLECAYPPFDPGAEPVATSPVARLPPRIGSALARNNDICDTVPCKCLVSRGVPKCPVGEG